MSTILRHRRKAFSDSWSPLTLGAQLDSWFKADSIVGVSNGGSVTSWPDSGTNSRTITYAATRPTYSSAAQNNKPAVQFSGGGMGAATFASAPLSGATSAAGFYVFKALSGNLGAVLNTFAQGLHCHEPYTDSNVYVSFGSTARYSVTGVPSLTSQFRIVSIRASSTWRYTVDGTGVYSTASTFYAIDSNYFGIGYQKGNSNGAYSLTGLICEVVLTNSDTSDANAQRVEGYLAWKYGLQGSLPANHPYKLKAP